MSIPGIPVRPRQESAPKQPLVPPTNRQHREPSNDENLMRSPPSSQQGIPGSEQAVPGITQLVTGRINPKPAPPPKPNFKAKQKG